MRFGGGVQVGGGGRLGVAEEGVELIALAFILNGKVEPHRRWMTRSFSVALVFLEVRVLLGVTGWENLGPHAVEAAVWACNVFALFAADLVLQWQELLRARGVKARS